MIFIPGTGGNIIYFHPLVKKLKIGLPCFGIQALGLYDDFSPLNQISEIVETYIKAIKEAGLKPPYHFLGHSLGAITVFELVQALRKKEDIGQVILLDMMAPTKDSKPSHFPVNNQEWILYALRHMERYLQTPLVIDTAMLSIANSEEKYELFKQALVSAGVIPASTNREVVRKFVDVLINNTLAYKNYCPTGKAMHPLHLVKASEIHDDDFRPEVLLHSPDWGWQQFADRVVVHQMSLGDHLSIFAEPAVNQLAEIIEQIFAQEIVNA
ncbi:thioesterase domain-containing protein [Legionella sp.]|uniref:thioesterase domain-containing protein n=1 Tax=Legionella sp. TaxID=459 RepID=UPI0032208BE5